MLKMTNSGIYAESQAFGEVFHQFVADVFLWQLLPDGLQSHFQRINNPGLRLELTCTVLFRHGAPDMIVQRVQVWRLWWSLILLNEVRTVRLQPMMRDARRASELERRIA